MSSTRHGARRCDLLVSPLPPSCGGIFLVSETVCGSSPSWWLSSGVKESRVMMARP